MEGLPAEFRGQVFDYETVARQSLTRPVPDYPLYRALFPGWDDSARKRLDATIFHNAAPDRYEYWLRGLVDYTQRNSRGDRRIIFVNAWNRWAEGAHLEPDLKHGTEYLQATQRALTTQTDPRQLVSLLTAELRTIRNRGQRERMAAYAREIGAQLGHLASTIEFFTEERQMVERLGKGAPRGGVPPPYARRAVRRQVRHRCRILARIDQRSPDPPGFGRRHQQHRVYRGLDAQPGDHPEAETTERYILLKCVEDDTVYAAQFWQHTDRQDVAAAHPDLDERFTLNCAFELLFSFSRVPADTYLVGCGLAGAGGRLCLDQPPHQARRIARRGHPPVGGARRSSGSANKSPINCAATKPGASIGRMPAKVSLSVRAIVTAGLANEVEAVNQ